MRNLSGSLKRRLVDKFVELDHAKSERYSRSTVLKIFFIEDFWNCTSNMRKKWKQRKKKLSSRRRFSLKKELKWTTIWHTRSDSKRDYLRFNRLVDSNLCPTNRLTDRFFSPKSGQVTRQDFLRDEFKTGKQNRALRLKT
jgi:hypothetical protein